MTPDPGYEVSISGAVRERLILAHDEAAAAGRRTEFLAALRDVSRRPRTDPTTFGVELFDLRALRLTVRVAAVLPLAVEFGVYTDRRLVFVRTFRYIPPG
ncbi:MAG: hypothetical protein K2P78_00020 [Gemmataceae bacterium]|nr:hypothetical protein [Gemmataceae bacterium]